MRRSRDIASGSPHHHRPAIRLRPAGKHRRVIHGATATPLRRLAGRSIGRHPPGRRRRIRNLGGARQFGLSRRALSAGCEQRHGSQHPGRPRDAGPADPSPHQCRTRSDGRRIPLLRPGAGRRAAAATRRAAHDPPSVRPGRVRQRAVVPPGGEHPGGQHRHRGPGHDGQAQAARVRRWSSCCRSRIAWLC